MLDSIKKYLSLITFSHTIFAMPFAFIGLVLGIYKTDFSNHDLYYYLQITFFVVLCMVFARSAAMGFNRFIDANFDAKNPRTKTREIPAGIISKKNALGFVIIMSIGFLISSYCINFLCFYLSPIALFVILFYSYTKRFTSLCHLVLGVGLGLAPIGAFLAITSLFEIGIVYLGIAVMLWSGGFDIIYSLQDEDFDRSQNLKSIPVFLGRKKAMFLSKILHFLCSIFLLLFGLSMFPTFWFALGFLFFAAFLFYQHTLFTETDLSRVNRAFMTSNGVASFIFGLILITGLITKIYIKHG